MLTLEGDEERRQPLLDQLKEMGMPYRLVFGVDSRRGIPLEYESMIDRRAAKVRLSRSMTNGEFGCALSHQLIYRLILDEGQPGALILEDDVVLQKGFASYLREGFHRTATLLLFDFGRARALPWQKEEKGRWIVYRVAQTVSRTSAYSISSRSAEHLIKLNTPVSCVADWPGDLYKLRAFLVTPKLASQRCEDLEMSHLELERRMVSNARKDPKRYFKRDYWQGYWRRKLSRPVGR